MINCVKVSQLISKVKAKMYDMYEYLIGII